MTFDQIAIVVLLVGMLCLFAFDRQRMEVVAIGGLAAGFVLGLVPAQGLFAGFANPAVITVIEILLIVQVLSRTALFDRLAASIVSAHLGERTTIGILCVVSASLSVFMNNIGALALMIPVVYGVCQATAIAPARVFMPVSFATLLGGICSPVGTPANLIASGQLRAQTGHGFAFFDFAWAGIPAALAGLAAIIVWAPRWSADLPKPLDESRAPRMLAMAARVSARSSLAGTPVGTLPFVVHSIQRSGKQVFLRARDTTLEPGDVVLLQAPELRLDDLLRSGELALSSGVPGALPSTQAVVMPESTVVGSRAGNLLAFTSRGVDVVAISPRKTRIEGTFEDVQLSIGDILYLVGPAERIADALAETEMLAVGGPGPRQRPASGFGLSVFAAGIILAATSLVPPQVAFGGVVLILAAAGTLELRAALAALNWPILIMLAAMIPLGGAVETTGLAKALAEALVAMLPAASTASLTGAMLLLALVVTPFVNNASTMIVLGPIAIDVARASGMPPEALLIAVAMGASIDFLTPFGHHNNTVVMGLGGYRFVDYLSAGWVATVITGAVGLLFIVLMWTS